MIKFGIRPSTQRMAVMSYLFANRHKHPTVDQIYLALSPDMPTLSKTTVYNTLKILESRGAIRSLFIDRVSERFDAVTALHGHSLCRRCGSISDVPLKDELFASGNAPETMTVESVQLFFKGVCGKCLGKAQRAG